MLTHRSISAGLVRPKSGMHGQPSQHSAFSVYHLEVYTGALRGEGAWW